MWKINFWYNHSHSTKWSVLAQGWSKGQYWLFRSALSSVQAPQRVRFVFWETFCTLRNNIIWFSVLEKHASSILKAAPAPWAEMPSSATLKSLCFTTKVKKSIWPVHNKAWLGGAHQNTTLGPLTRGRAMHSARSKYWNLANLGDWGTNNNLGTPCCESFGSVERICFSKFLTHTPFD